MLPSSCLFFFRFVSFLLFQSLLATSCFFLSLFAFTFISCLFLLFLVLLVSFYSILPSLGSSSLFLLYLAHSCIFLALLVYPCLPLLFLPHHATYCLFLPLQGIFLYKISEYLFSSSWFFWTLLGSSSLLFVYLAFSCLFLNILVYPWLPLIFS